MYLNMGYFRLNFYLYSIPYSIFYRLGIDVFILNPLLDLTRDYII